MPVIVWLVWAVTINQFCDVYSPILNGWVRLGKYSVPTASWRAENIFIQPGKLLFQRSFRVMDRSMPITGKKDKSHVRFSRLLKCPIIHPALFDWSAIILHSKKDK